MTRTPWSHRGTGDRYGWNRPRTPGWLGYTITVRLLLLLSVVYLLAR